MHTQAKQSDRALIRQVLTGQRDSFGVLVERYFHAVYAVAYARTGNRADAEDVAQETFIKAFASLDTLRDAKRLGGWLAVIARRVSYRLHERARRRGELEKAAQEEKRAVSTNLEQRETVEKALRVVRQEVGGETREQVPKRGELLAAMAEKFLADDF